MEERFCVLLEVYTVSAAASSSEACCCVRSAEADGMWRYSGSEAGNRVARPPSLRIMMYPVP